MFNGESSGVFQCRFLTNSYLREEPNSHVVEQRVEWYFPDTWKLPNVFSIQEIRHALFSIL
jgi:hypothetical protein